MNTVKQILILPAGLYHLHITSNSPHVKWDVEKARYRFKFVKNQEMDWRFAMNITRAFFYVLEELVTVFMGSLLFCVRMVIQEASLLVEPWLPCPQTSFKNVT